MLYITDICGESSLIADDDWHYLYSPNFPGNYPDNAECTWSIQAANSNFIELQLLHFDLETNYDYMTLYNGESTSDPLLASLTSTIIETAAFIASWTPVQTVIAEIEQMSISQLPTYHSSGAHMMIKFTSDYMGSRQGFLVRFRGINSLPSSTTMMTTSTPITNSHPTGRENFDIAC